MVAVIAKSDLVPVGQQPNSPRIAGPIVLGNPAVPSANRLTTWGIQVVDPGVPVSALSSGGALDPLAVWKSQPSVRKVVDFIARQTASVPWHAYVRVSDTDRQRVQASPAERALSHPRRFQSGFDLWHKVAVDKCLYDAWCVVLLDGQLQRVPPPQLRITVDAFGNTDTVGIANAAEPHQVLDITNEAVALGWGWSGSGGGGVSPMTTLAAILTENANAVAYSSALWANGPKVSGFITRPAQSPWSDAARDRFENGMRTFRNSKAGGWPLLEDGMSVTPLDNVSPSSAQDIGNRQLTDAEVSSAFHIAPELVGARPGNFSNIAAFRQMLFGPALGPYLEEFQQAVNAELVPALDATDRLYVELDRESAMNGSFLEQAAVLSTSVGGPWLTRNEARSKQNLTALPGGDELIVPLNVTAGGQASPQDSGSQNRTGAGDPNAETTAPKSAGPMIVKADKDSPAQRSLAERIAALFGRQTAEVEQGTKVDPEKFHEQWNAIAADVVHDHMFGSAAEGAQRVLQQLDAPAGVWSADVMRNYIAAMAATVGADVTATAVEHINADEWPADPDAPNDGPAHAGLVAGLATAAGVWAVSALANAAGFGAHDGAHAAGARTKTWNTGENPRPAHAAIDGETVAFDDAFSIGVRWPGDSEGDTDQTTNCNCGVEFSL